MSSRIKIDHITYINSSSDIYIKRQWDTAHCGPAYAESMGLKYKAIMEADFNGIFIVDTVITEQEAFYIEKIATDNKDSTFIFKIIDPYFEYERNKYFFQLLFRVANYENVLFLSNLKPSELTLELSKYAGQHKLLFLPYPYQKSKELNITYDEFILRKNKVCYSGAVNNLIYPNRTKFIKRWKFNPFLWKKIEQLKHPGYKDRGTNTAHNIIGIDYISHLASYQTMFCDASRSRLEFVKFSECAYAHCLPFGEAPDSFTEEIKKFFIQIDYTKFSNSVRKVHNMPNEDKYEISKMYRATLKKERNTPLLQYQLLDFINNYRNK